VTIKFFKNKLFLINLGAVLDIEQSLIESQLIEYSVILYINDVICENQIFIKMESLILRLFNICLYGYSGAHKEIIDFIVRFLKEESLSVKR
jgi:hypothetical protein